jgi:DNA-binding LacI/PurR family transcriptional regulator
MAAVGFLPVVYQPADARAEAAQLETLIGDRVSGVVLLGGQYERQEASRQIYDRLEDVGMPSVLVGSAAEGLGSTTVSTDDAAGMGKAIRFLRHLGHSQIGMLFDSTHVPSQLKLAAGRRLATVLGVTFTGKAISARGLWKAGAASTMVSSGTTAIICASPALADSAVRELHLNASGQVSILAVDAPLAAARGSITTLEQPTNRMARLIADTLSAQVDGQRSVASLLVEPNLVARASTRRRST